MISDINKASLVAKVIFMSPEIGGRKIPVVSGYRGQFFYNETDCDAVHVFESEAPVPFGVSVLDYVFLINPIHVERVSVGMPVLIREGPNTVAYGQITWINLHLEPGNYVPPHQRSISLSESLPETACEPDAISVEESESSKTVINAYWLGWQSGKEGEDAH